MKTSDFTTLPQIGDIVTNAKGIEYRVANVYVSDWLPTMFHIWVIKADGSTTRRTRVHFHTN